MNIKEYKENGIKFVEVESGNLKVTLCDLGASIFSIYYYDDIMTLTPIDSKDFKKNTLYLGKTIGPIGNRVKDGKVEINNSIYKLDINEDTNSLHSGLSGLSNKFFSYKIKEEENVATITYYYVKKHLEDGLPGNLTYFVNYVIKNESIYLTFMTKSDEATIVSLTNHTFFSLGEKNLDNIRLKIPARKYIHPNPSDLIPMEERKVNKVMSFRRLRYITDRINSPYLLNSKTNGYDHHYIFGKFLLKEIRLVSPKYELDIYTDFSGCQIYTCNYKTDAKLIGTEDTLHQGIAIEPQDSTLNREVLKKDTKYIRSISYSFKKRY
ncbi:MAG: hypothetical protein MJ248_07020 [Bacilli bacterium]|nr:hypothetical protein [Bacilli bacterium]